MKKHIMAMAFCAVMSLTAVSQSQADNADAANVENKEATLEQRRDELKAQIKQEEAKRNRQIAGVAPETIERINIEQDSLCLALRSELIEVELQISEQPETAVKTPGGIDYDSMIRRASSAAKKGQAEVGKSEAEEEGEK